MRSLQKDLRYSHPNRSRGAGGNKQSQRQMPAEAHGDKHDVVVQSQVPLRAARRVKNKTDLEGGSKHDCKQQALRKGVDN